MATFNELLAEYTEEAREAEEARRAEKRFRPIEGYPFWPHEVVRDAVILCFFTAAVIYLSAFMPYYLETPADPAGQPQVILPDWYLLWTYGMLKICEDITIGAGFAGASIGGWNPFPITIMSAKLWGIAIQGVVMGFVALVPFMDRGYSRRPVESPFWASAGFAGLIYVFMISVYSINNVIYEKWPVFGQEYGTWLADYFTIFRFDLLSWLTNLLPVVAFFATYIPLWYFKKQHGYEAKLNANYYKVR